MHEMMKEEGVLQYKSDSHMSYFYSVHQYPPMLWTAGSERLELSQKSLCLECLMRRKHQQLCLVLLWTVGNNNYKSMGTNL